MGEGKGHWVHVHTRTVRTLELVTAVSLCLHLPPVFARTLLREAGTMIDASAMIKVTFSLMWNLSNSGCYTVLSSHQAAKSSGHRRPT